MSRNFGAGNGIFLYRSTDQGVTFGPTGGTFIASGNQGAYVAVGPDHSVYAFWWAGSTIQMRKSTDLGVTFGAPVTVATFVTTGGTNGDLGLTGIRQGTSTASGFRSSRFPHAAVNPVSGAIYVTYNDDSDGAGPDKANVFVVQSTNGGTTWSAPIQVNDDGTNTDQWQPTLAVTPGGDKLGVFYYSRQEDPAGNNLFKYYGRVASISGSTLSFAPSFAVSSTPSLPEFGRDSVVNSVYMGDYNTAYATAGAFHVSWSDNRDDLPGGAGRKDPNVYYQKVALGLAVTTTTPAVGSIVSSVPVDYTVNFTDPIQTSTVQATDFQVDGVNASSFVINTSQQVTFHFNTAPFSTQGVHTMTMPAGAILRDPDGSPLAAFSGTFRYDALTLMVTSTVPPVGGTFTLPGPFTYDVNFNEPVDPASVQTADLALSGIAGAIVTGVTVLPGNTTARFTIGGVTSEGTLNASIAAGAITDAFGNPGAAFSGSYAVDIGTVPYPTPLSSEPPAGSLIYDPTATGIVSFAGDTDSFTLNIDPGQTITVLLTPTSAALQPTVQVLNPASAVIASATAAAAGQNALVQTVTAATGGTYTFSVSGAGGTVGNYTLRFVLNAALEQEGLLAGSSNNTRATAQDLSGSFVNLQTDLASASRAAAVGGDVLALTPITTFDFESGQQGFIINNGPNPGHVAGLWHLSTGRGTQAGHSPVTSFYFGQGEGPGGGGNYNVGNTAGSITSAPIALPSTAGLALNFNYVLQTEGNGSFDVASVQVSNNGGATFTTILSSTSAAQLPLRSTWGAATASLAAFAGQTVLIRFNFDTIDSVANAFEGWYVDDVSIVAPATWNDYYSFTVGANTAVSAALKLTSGSGANVFLEDSTGAVLATGAAGATNFDRGITNFNIAAAGTYYLRVSGGPAATYDVELTRNAAIDTEGNSTAATAQVIDGNKGALGFTQDGSSVLSDFETGQQGYVINNNIRGTGNAAGLWHLSTRRGTQTGHSAVTSFYYGSETTGTYDTGAANAGSITSPVIALPVAASIPLTFNYVLQTEGNGSFDVASVQVSTNGFATFTTVLSSTSSAQLPLRSTWGAATANLAAFSGQNVQIRFLFDTVDSIANAFEGWYVDDVLIGTAADPDWYSVTLAPGQTALQLATNTPADGPGQFTNTLNPKIQLFDSTGTVLIANGVVGADGRNEALLATGLTAGATYKVRVVGEGGTAGEYFLGTTALATPTPTDLVDNTSFGFTTRGAWATVSGGYGGSYRQIAGGGDGSLYAQWQYSANFTAGNSYGFYVTWVASAGNATNARYKIYDGATLLATVTLDQTRSPNTALVGGSLWQQLYVYTPATTGLHVIRVQVDNSGNGNVIADGFFDPPIALGMGGATALLALSGADSSAPRRETALDAAFSARAISDFSWSLLSPARQQTGFVAFERPSSRREEPLALASYNLDAAFSLLGEKQARVETTRSRRGGTAVPLEAAVASAEVAAGSDDSDAAVAEQEPRQS